MKKIVLKSALFAVTALALAALLIFSLWILCSPQTMATASEKAGNYSFAVTCADLRYKYTKDSSDLARCAEDAILSGKDKYILKYGEKLIYRDDFDLVCTKRNEQLSQNEFSTVTSDYKSYICGSVAAAQFRGGSLETAVKTASIPRTETAFIKLTRQVSETGSQAEKEALKGALNEKGYTDLVKYILERQ